MDATTVKAREYLRVSQDDSGRERSPEEQHADNVRTARANGWTLGDPYDDLGSASPFATKEREDFGQLLADLLADRFGADILMLWESSRGSRRVEEWVRLIALLAERHVKVHVTTHDHTYDPRVRRDWRSMMDDAVRSEDESRLISERVLRAMASNATGGRPHGVPPFGYMRHYEMDGTVKIIHQVPDPAEAPVVDELFERYEAGHAIAAIATDFERRGIRTRSGRPWTPQHLRSLLRTAAYAGWRVHKGERFEADWPAIVPRRRWLAAQRRLDDGLRLGRPGGAKHLLSLIALCDVCGGPLRVTAAAKEEQYTCRDHGHVLVDKRELDVLVWDLVVSYLSDRTNYRGLMEVADDGELDRIATELAEARADQDALADLSARLAAKMEPPLRVRIAELERREEDLRTPSLLSALLPPGESVGARLGAAPLSAQRTVMRMVLIPERLGEVRILRSPEWPRRVPVGRRVFWRRDR